MVANFLNNLVTKKLNICEQWVPLTIITVVKGTLKRAGSVKITTPDPEGKHCLLPGSSSNFNKHNLPCQGQGAGNDGSYYT